MFIPLLALDVPFMWEIAPTMLKAAWITIQISTVAVIFGIFLGFLLGYLRVTGPSWIQFAIQGFVDFIRGVPPLVHIAFIYFVMPQIGIVLNEYWTGVIALSLIAAGYEVEIFRAGIESIERGQKEAAISIGMTPWVMMINILFPQALKRMLPALTNELANVIKASSLLSVISVNELTHVGNAIIFQHFVFAEVLIQVTILYLIIVGSLMWASSYLEEKISLKSNDVLNTDLGLSSTMIR